VQFLVCDEWSVTQATTELDASGKDLQAPDAALLGGVISNNGAILKLIFGGDKCMVTDFFGDDKWVTPEPAALEVGMTEADFSNKHLGVGGAISISAWISHNGTLTSLNLSNTYLSQGRYRGNMRGGMRNNPENYEQDLTGVISLADAIPDMGALTSLNLSSNRLGVEGTKIIAEAIKVTNCAIAIILLPFSCHI
jgi:hypothetical protein